MTATAIDTIDRSLARVAELSITDILNKFSLYLDATSKDGRNWSVRIPEAGFMDNAESGATCRVALGQGRSVDLALVDLCSGISGKLMVLGADTADRHVVQMPQRVLA